MGASSREACGCQPGYYPTPTPAAEGGGGGIGGMNAGAVAMTHGSNCSACVEGGVCPGGRAVLARVGWCEAGTVATGNTGASVNGSAGNEGV